MSYFTNSYPSYRTVTMNKKYESQILTECGSVNNFTTLAKVIGGTAES